MTIIIYKVRTYALQEQNQLRQRLWIKVTFYTINGLILLIFQFNCISPKSIIQERSDGADRKIA